MTAIYNEIEPYAARWLANLIAAGHVAPGSVDERSICDLEPADLAGPGQRHFFAGLGGWSLALRLAGVPDDAPIWTGSCPCQPLSVAGLQRGADDARHLWPAWHRLIAECRPSVVFGEQVAGRAGLEWLAAVRHDLEDLGYAVGAADLAAASVAAPQIRQRIFFGARLADRDGARWSQWDRERGDDATQRPAAQRSGDHDRARLADRDPPGWIVEWRGRLLGHDVDGRGPAGDGLGHGEAVGRGAWRAGGTPRRATVESSGPGDDRGRMGCAVSDSPGRHPGASLGQETKGHGQRVVAGRVGHPAGPSGRHDPWADAELVECLDPKRGTVYRPAPPAGAGIPIVAHGLPGRVARLRAGGNAIVPQVAAAFVAAFLEVT